MEGKKGGYRRAQGRGSGKSSATEKNIRPKKKSECGRSVDRGESEAKVEKGVRLGGGLGGEVLGGGGGRRYCWSPRDYRANR